jgi:hypothetical protein
MTAERSGARKTGLQRMVAQAERAVIEFRDSVLGQKHQVAGQNEKPLTPWEEGKREADKIWEEATKRLPPRHQR